MINTFEIAPRAVLFDHDDTLVGTIKPKFEQHKFIAREYFGKEVTDELIRTHWGKPLHELIGILYGTKDVEKAFEIIRAVHHNYPKILFDGSIDIFQQLHTSGIKTGIITATTRESIGYDFSLLKFPTEHIDYIQTSDEVGFHKPDPRVFDPATEMLAAFEIKSNQIIYIGDGLHDMEAAVSAGLQFIGVETGLVTAEQFRANGAKSFPQIKDIAQYLNQRTI